MNADFICSLFKLIYTFAPSFKNAENMPIVNSKEFTANIQERVYYKPDEDFYNSISIEELRERVLEDVHQWYREKNKNNESHCHSKSTALS